MVPNGWTPRKLGKQADTQMGFAFKSTDFVEQGVPLVRMGNLYQNNFDLSRNPVFLPGSFLDEYERFILRPGDLIMSLTGTMGKQDYGFTIQIPNGSPNCLLNQRVMKFIPKDATDKTFLLHLLKSQVVLSKLYSFPGGTKQANLSAAQVKGIKVDIPPLPEQKKIARILSTWDKAIETVDKLIENSQQQKKALMQQLLTGKKRLPGFSGEWKEVRLGEVCKFSGGAGFKEDYQGTPNGDYPFIKVSDMNLLGNEKYITRSTNWISEETRKIIGAKAFPKNSIVFAKVGAALLLNRRRILIRDTLIDNNMMAAVCSKNAHHEFIYQLLLRIDFAKYVQEGAVPSINQSTLNAIKVHMPPLNEQVEIAKVLNGMEQLVASCEQQQMNISQQKQALMQQLLTGKRRVNV